MKKVKIKEKYSGKELAESFIFRNKLTAKQRQQEAAAINLERKKLKDAGKHYTLQFKLLQLKYQMEDAIGKPFNKYSTFGFFLKAYMEILELKQYQLAKDISVDKTYLSQLVNGHRSPSEEVMIRLELHSRSFINASTWFRLSERAKENEIRTNKSLRAKEKKFVRSVAA